MANRRRRRNQQDQSDSEPDESMVTIINGTASTPRPTTRSMEHNQQHNQQQIIIPNGYRLVPDNGSGHHDNDHMDFSSHSKINVQVYKGLNDKLTIENWFKRFEIISDYYKWNNDKKIIMLGNYLEDDALNWYLENLEINDWNELKENLISRFSLGSADPMIEFVEYKYDFKVGIKDYFEKKRRLGILAKLNESQIIPIMIQGLNYQFKSHFVTVQPKSYSEFYRIAKAIEDNLNDNFKNRIKIKNNTIKKSSEIKSLIKKKPPSACRICESLGYKNRFHWANECKNKNKNQNSNSKQVTNTLTHNKQANLIDRNESDLNEYPILENITLN